ncbi:MAG: lasso RiPP family leader peptide-containing protein [Erythrobacter sp.]
MKATYKSPSIEDLGCFEALTQGTSAGGRLDASFAVGTPEADLTFS